MGPMKPLPLKYLLRPVFKGWWCTSTPYQGHISCSLLVGPGKATYR